MQGGCDRDKWVHEILRFNQSSLVGVVVGRDQLWSCVLSSYFPHSPIPLRVPGWLPVSALCWAQSCSLPRIIHHHHAAGREQECAFLHTLPLPSAILLLLLKTEAGGRENKAVEYRQGRSGDTCWEPLVQWPWASPNEQRRNCTARVR